MSQPDTGNIAVIVAMVAGLSSLIGAFAGAALTRKTEHIKWLRESRSEVFSSFLEKLQKSNHDTLSIDTKNSSEDEIGIAVIQIFADPMRYERIVRLYLPENRRAEFSKLVAEFWKYSGSATINNKKLSYLSYVEPLNKIQELFEEQLRG